MSKRLLTLLAFVSLACLPLKAEPGSGILLPAYSHNDYRNDIPLLKALELGYRGVEVDYLVADGELLVGHSRSEVRPGYTVERLYLKPLKEIADASGGRILDGDQPFLLFLESKQQTIPSYTLLRDVLARYDSLLTIVRDGEVRPGPVQVVLVGWFPKEMIESEPVRRVSIQVQYSELRAADLESPSHLVKLVSQRYDRMFRWRGKGRMPARDRENLKALVASARAPGRLVRVYEVPRNGIVYEKLVEEGVDLIGTKTIESSRELLIDLVSR